MDDDDPRIITYTPNHAHECTLCNIKLSLSWSENKHKKFGKANVNYQNAQAMCHLTNNDSYTEDMTSRVVNSKSKIDVNQEVIKRNLLSSCASHRKGINKKLKGIM